jgi:hypothetical protein
MHPGQAPGALDSYNDGLEDDGYDSGGDYDDGYGEAGPPPPHPHGHAGTAKGLGPPFPGGAKAVPGNTHGRSTTASTAEKVNFDLFLQPSEALAALYSEKASATDITIDFGDLSTFDTPLPPALRRHTSIGREEEVSALTEYIERVQLVDQDPDGVGICGPMDGLRESNYYFRRNKASAGTNALGDQSVNEHHKTKTTIIFATITIRAIHMYGRMDVCIYVGIYACTYVCMYVRAYICTHRWYGQHEGDHAGAPQRVAETAHRGGAREHVREVCSPLVTRRSEEVDRRKEGRKAFASYILYSLCLVQFDLCY